MGRINLVFGTTAKVASLLKETKIRRIQKGISSASQLFFKKVEIANFASNTRLKSKKLHLQAVFLRQLTTFT